MHERVHACGRRDLGRQTIRAIGAEFTLEMREKARTIAHETLKNLEKLPECVESDWLENLPEEES
jgi:hypothetical protein